MRVLITGSNGFIGKNLVSTLETMNHIEILKFDKEHTLSQLKALTQNCDFVIHLAGVNRPDNIDEFYEGNATLTELLCQYLNENKNNAPILMTSSIQANLDNDYGKSKRAAELILEKHYGENAAPVYIYRLPNLFGKWSRPFYNSVVATWCYQIARGEMITVTDEDIELTFVYIDDLIREIVQHLVGNRILDENLYYEVEAREKIRLGDLASVIKSFKSSRESLMIPNMNHVLTRKLYSTYLTYMPTDDFSYFLTSHEDQRGSFTEFAKAPQFGQVSVNISKPGITKGNHWHHSKNEKFLVVKGTGCIQLRDIFSLEIIEYHVSDQKLEVVDIPPGYTHNIINAGDTDLVTLMWVNELYDELHPDTYYQEV